MYSEKKKDMKAKSTKTFALVLVCFLILQLSSSVAFGEGKPYQDADVSENIFVEDRLTGVDIDVDAPDDKNVEEGATVSYTFVAENIGDRTLEFVPDLYASRGWSSIDDEDDGSFGLGPGGTKEIGVTTNVPDNIDGYAMEKLTLTVMEVGNEDNQDDGVVHTHVGREYDVTVSPMKTYQPIRPGEEESVDFSVENTGNVDDTFKITSTVGNDHWEIDHNKDSITLSVGETGTVTATFSAPNITHEYRIGSENKNVYYGPPGATEDIVIRAEASNGFTSSGKSVGEVEPVFIGDTHFEEDTKTIGPGSDQVETHFDSSVYNLANIQDKDDGLATIHIDVDEPEFEPGFELGDEMEPGKWLATNSIEEVTLESGESVEDIVNVIAPPNALHGEATTNITAIPEMINQMDASEWDRTRQVTVEVRQEGGVSVETLSEDLMILPDGERTVEYEVTNYGNGPDRFYLEGGVDDDDGWCVEIEDDKTEELLPEESTVVEATYTAPQEMEPGEERRAWLEATSEHDMDNHDFTASDDDSITFTAGERSMVSLSIIPNEKILEPLEWTTFEVKVENLGNVNDTYQLSALYGGIEEVEHEFHENPVSVEAFDETTTYVDIKPTLDALYDEDYNFTIQAESLENDGYNTTYLHFGVEKYFDLDAHVESDEIDIKPGQTRSVWINVTNKGNYDKPLDFSQDIGHLLWDIEPGDDLEQLEPGSTELVRREITAPDMDVVEDREELIDASLMAGSEVNFTIEISELTSEEIVEVQQEVVVGEVRAYEVEKLVGTDTAVPRIETELEFKLINHGNVDDDDVGIKTVSGAPHEDYHEEWGEPKTGRLSVDALDSTTFDFALEPRPEDNPYHGENASIVVRADNEYARGNASIDFEISSLHTPTTAEEGVIGGEHDFPLYIVNVPSEEYRRDESFDNDISIEYDTENLTESEEWDITLEEEVVSFDNAYEVKNIALVVDVPEIEIDEIQCITITIESDEYDQTDSADLELDLGWFDMVPEISNIERGDDGVNIEFDIRIHGHAPTKLTELHDVEEDEFPRDPDAWPPFNLMVNNETVATHDQTENILYVRNEEKSDYTIYTFEVEAVEEHAWHDLEHIYRIELIVNPEDEEGNRLYEINAEGDAYENNVVRENVTYTRFGHSIIVYFVLASFAIVLSAILVAMGKKRNDYLYLSVGAGLTVFFFSLYAFPWSDIVSPEQTNTFGYWIIAGWFATIGVYSLIVPLFLKAELSRISKIATPSEYKHILEEFISDKEALQKPLTKSLSFYRYIGACAANAGLYGALLIILANLDRTDRIPSILLKEFAAVPPVVILIGIVVGSAAIATLCSFRLKKMWVDIAEIKEQFQSITEESDFFPEIEKFMKGGDDNE